MARNQDIKEDPGHHMGEPIVMPGPIDLNNKAGGIAPTGTRLVLRLDGLG